MPEIVFGGLPTWLIETYLEELGGLRAADHTVEGAGWRATLTSARGGAGDIAIARVTVSIEGDKAAAILQSLRKKAQRGGG